MPERRHEASSILKTHKH